MLYSRLEIWKPTICLLSSVCHARFVVVNGRENTLFGVMLFADETFRSLKQLPVCPPHLSQPR